MALRGFNVQDAKQDPDMLRRWGDLKTLSETTQSQIYTLISNVLPKYEELKKSTLLQATEIHRLHAENLRQTEGLQHLIAAFENLRNENSRLVKRNVELENLQHMLHMQDNDLRQTPVDLKSYFGRPLK